MIVPLIDELGDRVLHFRRSIHVDFPGKIDDVGVTLRFADVDLDIHSGSLLVVLL